MKRSILLLSNSYVYGNDYLVHYTEPLKAFLKNIPLVLFVPYATDEKDWDTYTQIARNFFNTIGIAVLGIHQIPEDRIFTDFNAIFMGGGNTLRLIHELHSRSLLSEIRSSVLSGKIKYVGVSAGANVAGKKICITSDMPVNKTDTTIDGLNLFPFQINPHDGDCIGSVFNNIPLIGLRAGTYLCITPNTNFECELFLGGNNGKIASGGKECIEIPLSTKFILTPDGRLMESKLD